MRDYASMDTAQLLTALEEYRAIIRSKGAWICVFERGQCERILAELERRK
jgi:hypothetical protein